MKCNRASKGKDRELKSRFHRRCFSEWNKLDPDIRFARSVVKKSFRKVRLVDFIGGMSGVFCLLNVRKNATLFIHVEKGINSYQSTNINQESARNRLLLCKVPICRQISSLQARAAEHILDLGG